MSSSMLPPSQPETTTTTNHKPQPQPHISVSASLSPSKISLSDPSLATLPLTLHLTLRLSHSPSPITVYTGDSFLSSAAQSALQSDYRLRCLRTGTVCPASVIRKYRTDVIRIRDPQLDFLELNPGEAVSRDVRIGVHALKNSGFVAAGRENQPTPLQSDSPTGEEEEEEVSICATPMKELSKGEDYEVQLAHAPGEWPNHVWWWTCGTKEALVREAGGRGSEGLMVRTLEGGERIFAVKRGGVEGFVRVEMVERAVVEVVG